MQVSGRKQNIGSRYRGGSYNNQVSGARNHLPNSPGATAGSKHTDLTQVNVYNQGYSGKTYSVKYLGIVDGTMGILSRKMALTAQDQAAVTIQPEGAAMPGLSPQMHQIISEDHFTDVRVTSNEIPPKHAPPPMQPVLGKKNYTDTIGRHRRKQIIDENTHMIHEIQNGNFRIGPYGPTKAPPGVDAGQALDTIGMVPGAQLPADKPSARQSPMIVMGEH